MKKILKSLFVLGVVAVVGVGATRAYFSDTETSTGNTFQAGALDLTVDSEQHYNGNECLFVPGVGGQVGVYQWVGNSPYPEAGTPCTGAWEATNLGAEHKFFYYTDVKPGDYGENTVSLHVDNDAWLRLLIKDVTDTEVTCTEPESSDDPEGVTCGTDGELRENLVFTVFSDANCDNVLNGTDQTLISSGPVDVQGEEWVLPGYLPGELTTCFGIAWNLPTTVGNEAQTDGMSATMEFEVVQHRHNTPNPWLF